MASIVLRTQLLAPMAFVAGCASAPSVPPATATAQATPLSIVGLEGVMGRNAAALTNRLGAPGLDVREGSARKLQFVNRVCVLDAYLYPRSGGGEAVVTHVDARLPDGRDVDRASCVASFNLRN